MTYLERGEVRHHQDDEEVQPHAVELPVALRVEQLNALSQSGVLVKRLRRI